jgi:hypothetical protein
MKIDNVKYSHLTITSGADENYSSSNWFEMALDGKFALFAIHTDDAQVKTVLNEKSEPVAKWTVAQPYVLELLVSNAIDHAIEESHAMQKEKFNTDTYTVRLAFPVHRTDATGDNRVRSHRGYVPRCQAGVEG